MLWLYFLALTLDFIPWLMVYNNTKLQQTLGLSALKYKTLAKRVRICLGLAATVIYAFGGLAVFLFENPIFLCITFILGFSLDRLHIKKLEGLLQQCLADKDNASHNT